MTTVSNTQPSVTLDPVVQSLPNLDEKSVDSFSSTDTNDLSIGRDFDVEIAKTTEKGEFFERDCFVDTVLEDIEVGYHLQRPHKVRKDNAYISSIDEVSDLYVRRPNEVTVAARKGPLHLFWLCFSKSFVKDLMLTATNRRLHSKDLRSVSYTELKNF